MGIPMILNVKIFFIQLIILNNGGHTKYISI